MTDTPRFRALSTALQRRRAEPFAVRIDGADPLEILCDDVTFEGAATSLQLHLRVSPGRFAEVFNAAQLATGPVLAVGGNSPTFLGHGLWEETRVALFKQAVDDRDQAARQSRREARVSFGTQWVQRGAFELFSEAVAAHEILLPVLAEEDPLEAMAAGRVPALEEVRLHQGTVWRWNRPVYDPAEGGHLRIEMRALPSGPTVTDMLANTAFMIGLTLGLAPRMEALVRTFPFGVAHNNFYRAAQLGLAAELSWPGAGGRADAPIAARALVPALLPVAHEGLLAAGVDAAEVDALLEVIAVRCDTGRTGASWQRLMLAKLEAREGRQGALRAMLECYIAESGSGRAVHCWPMHGEA
jgi:hypothetical protein